MFLYPWGDMHSLNLGWFLLQFKDWVEKIQEYLDNGGGTSENLANVIAPVFNAANYYSTGDYVLYNNELYKANQDVNPGTWDPDAWIQCLIVDEMGSGGGAGVDNVARLMIAGQYSAAFGYQKYAICRYNDKLWMCNTNLPSGGEAWTPAHWDEITVGAGLTGLRRSVETLSEDISNLNGALNNINFANATQVSTSGQDLNEYTNGGVWFFLYAANPSNRPNDTARFGFLTVYNGGNADRVTQIWIDSSVIKNNIYIRSHNSTEGWSGWRKLNDDSRTGGNLVAFGDSWTEGTGIANASDRPTKRFTAIVARKLNMTEFEFASGGEKFIGGAIQAEIATATNSMTATQIADTKIVLIVGGINDYRTLLGTNTASDFATAVKNCAIAAHTAFPNALIVLGIGNTSLSYFPHKAREWYTNAIRVCEQELIFPHICIKNLYNVISGLSELYENLPNRKFHPNDAGHAVFGGYIADAILGGGQHVSYTKDVTLNTGWSVASQDGIQGYAQLTRNDDELTIATFKLQKDSGSINENFGFGSIPAALAPYTNLYWPAVSGNLPQGSFALIPSGGFRVIMPSSFTGNSCFVSNNAWLFGKEVNNDE